MAKITCKCGNVIVDQSDSNRWKARFMPDQDYDDYLDVLDEPDSIEKRRVLHRVFHEIFQCPNCSSLIVFRNGNPQGIFFEPENREEAKQILQSGYGAEWKGFLTANYYDGKGSLHWYTNVESGYRVDLKLEELKQFYREKFDYLSGLNVLRSAFLRINGKMEHEFNPE